MRTLTIMLMLLMMSFSVSMPSFFANVNFSSEIIYAEEEEKTTSGDEEPDCE